MSDHTTWAAGPAAVERDGQDAGRQAYADVYETRAAGESGSHGQAKTGVITWPWTSVSRRSMPLW